MRAVIPWAEGELQTLAADPHSRVFSDLRKITVVLQPFHLQDLKTAVRDLLNASVNCYDKSLDGIFLGYDKLKVLSKSASVSAESSGVAIEIQANFYSFRPEIGCVLKGIVNKISNDHVGILVYQRFNISCPRPGSDAKSAKWIGNKVVMHQEVIFKLKEKNFSGKLPFFKGKIMDIGNVVTGLNEQDKKPKKKSKEIVPDESNSTETSSQVTKKSRKHKLDQSNENIEVKAKKSKKEVETLKRPVEKDADVSVAASELSSSKKKKKKVSIGSVDETDFIPRFSLDVSQLPEDLPPPNADSTHFDLTKNLSVSLKQDKKKKKAKSSDLTAIGEESADGSKVNSKLTDKSQQPSEEKPKKKSKTSIQEPSPSASEDAHSVKTPKKKNLKETVELNLLPSSSKKISKQAEATAKIVESPSVKDKKSKTAKSVNDSQLSAVPQNDTHHSKGSISIEVKNPLSPLKDKKKSKEDKTSPTKEKKSKREKSPSKEKMKEISSCSLTSEDLFPPGQRSFRASPKKQFSPRKDSIAHSPELEYFSVSRSMMDSELGTRSSGGQVRLMFGSLEGKIPGPPESPIKSSAAKKVDSDSDSDPPPPKKLASPIKSSAPKKVESDSDSDPPPPKKLTSPIKSSAAKKVDSDSDSDSTPPKKLVISSKSKDSSDSSDAENGLAAVRAKMAPRKLSEDDSDNSDFETAVQNRLLLSMGVMQSPFKTATPIVNHGSSESESDGSSDEDRLPRKVANMNSAKTEHVPKGTQNQTKGQESDSDDDLDAIRAAMLKVAENKQTKNKPSKSKPSKLAPNAACSKMSSPEKKSILKKSENVSQKNSKPNDESDSDIDVIKSAMVKVKEMASSESSLPKATRGKKLKSENQDVPAKKSKAASAEKSKLKLDNKISTNVSQESSKDLKNKPDTDDSDNDEVLKTAMQTLAPVSKKEKSKATPVKKSQLKSSESILTSVFKVNTPDSDDSDDGENEIMKAAVQAALKTKLDQKSKRENANALIKKTKAAPAEKTKPKHSTKTDLKNIPDKDDSDDKVKNQALKAAIQSLSPDRKKEKLKVSPVKKSQLKSCESISTSVSKVTSKGPKITPDSDDSDDGENEIMKAAIQAALKAKLEQKSKRENANALIKKTKAAPAEKTKLKHSSKTDSKNIPDNDDSDDDAENQVLKAAMQNLTSVKKGKDKTAKGKKILNKSEPEPSEKSSLPRVSNISGISDDSDSGPDDVNTTRSIEEMRQRQSAAKAVKPAKNRKNSDGEKSLMVNSSKSSSKKNKPNDKSALADMQSDSKKGKTSKGNTSKRIPNSEKNQKPRGKKKAGSDDEISNVMQRLLKKAQLGKL
ncbi:nucleolar protein dao-5-like [Thrips palmi]|uniref:Nucleolar protein dao-5-like n=1 Tax=Thrips palmi TaxID=161013 RepID=A0A6P9AAV3_THRPL|nr:nucleolar protein dao-5-like [Thrips palmi]